MPLFTESAAPVQVADKLVQREAVALADVPQTMLWTLHNRAAEASRSDGVLRDADALRIYNSIDYDFERSFGKPDGSHGLRSRVFDDAVSEWLRDNPGGTVVELACGLETQFQRCDDGQVNWLCIDVPEAIAMRERFLRPSARCRHLAISAFDTRWFEQVNASRPVFITAQGLLMYFERSAVCELLQAIAKQFLRCELMFDAIPRWFSRKTVAGYWRTPHYRTPPMPWGINRDEIASTLRSWMPEANKISLVPYGYIRGIKGMLLPVIGNTPILKNLLPSIVRVGCNRTGAA